MARKMIKGGALAAVCLLLFLAAVPREAQGAVAIDTEKADCSMAFSLSNTYGEELSSRAIPVKVYKIADVTASGTYVPEAAYEGIGLQDVNSTTSAAKWQEMAEAAAKIALPDGVLSEVEVPEAGVPTTKLLVGKKPDSITGAEELPGGVGTIEDLETGMYLVVAFATDSSDYTYYFSPYLVAVPGNDYYTTNDDTWIYDVTVSLKPAPARRWGYLRVIKNLTSIREGDQVSVIFGIEAQKNADDVTAVPYQYSGVRRYVFENPGTKGAAGNVDSEDTILIRLPAGTSVTVKELDPGSGYVADGSMEQTIRIEAGEPENAARAEFTNHYDGGMNGGTAVVNHFEPESDGTLNPSPTGEAETTTTIQLLSDEAAVDPDSIVWTWTQE